jgi:uncharacterized protein (TIGR02246 family)
MLKCSDCSVIIRHGSSYFGFLGKGKVHMKVLATLSGAAIVLLTVTACQQAPPPPPPDTHDADVKAISDLEAKWNSELPAKDADKLVNYYADDAVVFNSGEEPLRGKTAMRDDSKKKMAADPTSSMSFKELTVDVAKSGDLAYTTGSYESTGTDPKTHKLTRDHGYYVTNYRKQADGSWKAVSDIAISAVPPAPAKKR